MNEKLYIGIDNGVTGSIGVVGKDGFTRFIMTPVKKEQNYTMKKDLISRVDVPVLSSWLRSVVHDYEEHVGHAVGMQRIFVVLERPLVNPRMFKATVSAVRALEATVSVLEYMGLPFMYTDSKKWQRPMLPDGTHDTKELKKASLDIGCRLYPEHARDIVKHKDADGLLMAAWAQREDL